MSYDKTYPTNQNITVGPKIPKKKKPPYFEVFLAILPVFAGILAAWAMFSLHLETTASVIFKAAMVGVIVSIVSFCINKFAVDWGAELTASGLPLVGLFSVTSILAVGGCLWYFSFGGIVLPDVRVLRYEDHGAALSRYAELQNDKASQAIRIVPVINATGSDLFYHEKCEIDSGCLGGRGGGTGTISRILSEKAVRANDISTQLTQGTELLSSTLKHINELLEQYQTTLNDTEKSFAKRRQTLIKIDAEFGQAIATLKEAIPLSLIAAYADELNTPVNINNRPTATRAVTALLKKHGQALALVVSTIESKPVERPLLPAKAGLSDTLDYIGNFAALAGIIWVAECIFPLALFIYTLAFLIRTRELGGTPTHPSQPPSSPPLSMVYGSKTNDAGKTIQIVRKSQDNSNGKMDGSDHV